MVTHGDRWALLLHYKGCCFPRYRLCFVCEAGPHLLELGSGNTEDRRHESVVSCCEGHVPAVGHAHGAALRRTAALYESAAKVRVLFCLQGWGGENGGRQSSEGAVPRERVLRMPVLLQLQKTKKSGGKGVRQRLDSPLVCAAYAAEIFTGGWQTLCYRDLGLPLDLPRARLTPPYYLERSVRGKGILCSTTKSSQRANSPILPSAK